VKRDVVGIVVSFLGIVLGAYPLLFSDGTLPQVVGGIILLVSIVALIVFIKEAKKDARNREDTSNKFGGINENASVDLPFYQYDHTPVGCNATIYASGSKDQPKACIDALLNLSDDSDFYKNPTVACCVGCGGKFIQIQEREITIRDTHNIVLRFTKIAKEAFGYNSSSFNESAELALKETVVACVTYISQSVKNHFGNDAARRWILWTLENVWRYDM